MVFLNISLISLVKFICAANKRLCKKNNITLSSQFAQHPRHKEDGPSLPSGVDVLRMSPIPMRCNTKKE